MAVQHVQYQMSVPKEGKEIVDAVCGLVGHFVQGGKIEGAAAFLPAVMAAVDGYQNVGEEIASDGKDELAGYLVHKVLSALSKKA
jgi:hypothetical protein